MKRLILLRHAKAVGKDAAPDRDRVLAQEGRREMEAVARHLAAKEVRPDLALVSPSARTRETWTLAHLESVDARFDEGIYEADVQDLLHIVRGIDPSVASALLVGHNPGIEELANELIGMGERDVVSELRAGFPTAGLAVIDFDVADWQSMSPRTGRLVGFDTPDRLAAGA